MSYIKMKINDESIYETAEYCLKQGEKLQGMLDAYLDIMQRVISEGISNGETSQTINGFVSLVKLMEDVIENTSKEIYDQMINFLIEVDEQDRYIF